MNSEVEDNACFYCSHPACPFKQSTHGYCGNYISKGVSIVLAEINEQASQEDKHHIE